MKISVDTDNQERLNDIIMLVYKPAWCEQNVGKSSTAKMQQCRSYLLIHQLVRASEGRDTK